MSPINRSTTQEELAALITAALDDAGIRGTLSGGAAVSIYSENEYESVDLDFITSARNDAIAKALEPLGFRHESGKREFIHPGTDYYAEFPPGPLAFGETVVAVSKTALLETAFGSIRIVTPTQSVMDRLAHFVAWHDNQAFDQAAMVARRNDLDWGALEEWARNEGAPADILDRLRAKALKQG
jgi:hypothetical protein